MVKSLALLYVNMVDFENWNKAVCADERAFSMGMIEEGGKILRNSRIPVIMNLGNITGIPALHIFN